MKKFMFLFLIVAFVAVMAGGAIANGECPCQQTKEGELTVDMNVLPCHHILFTSSPRLCAFIPCEGWNDVCEDEAEFGFEFCASGYVDNRTMTVVTDYNDPHVELWLTMGTNTSRQLFWGGTEFGEYFIGNIPDDDQQTGKLKLKVFPDANAFQGPVTLTFTIICDQFDEQCGS